MGGQCMGENACWFIGHREIEETEDLLRQLLLIIEKLIVEDNVDTFLFGSKSRFNDLCYETVTELKGKYPHIRRIYVRAEYSNIDEAYKSYLLMRYEDTYFPCSAVGAGRAVYLNRNREMIDQSGFCVLYFRESCTPKRRKSGTKAALEYAVKQKRIIVRL